MRIVMKQAEVGYGVSHQSMELAVEKCRQAMRACSFLPLFLIHSASFQLYFIYHI